MMRREKQLDFGGGGGKQPFAQGSWLYGMLVGITVSNLVAGAMMAGAGAAIGKAIAGKPLHSPRRPARLTPQTPSAIIALSRLRSRGRYRISGPISSTVLQAV